ncbi:heme ABC transporter ATP-binding protein [Allorhizobium terrae]|uniref:Heme ABC transporter ATP-binding protein n=1 Tax=Allorhizobium terrae TaxID=1848972 RepID=A0A4S3ZQG8_9HYPH|nr:heme ABC transporter ATP-binding protein [Allorhizobium terrae]THF47806.1 heme ABC transporter ATP-binding protein [Allorhizobium terrae]
MADLTAHNLHVRYGGRRVLHGVNVCAKAGQVTVIAGPNGSGKSTLIKSISGEISYSGQVCINGTDLVALKAWQMAALRAVLPQETSVAFPYSVAEVVRFGLEAGAMGRSKRTSALIDAALNRVGLTGFANRLVSALSGGERQRVQLARVLCQIWEPIGDDGPRWLVMDEPVANLDIKHQIALMDIARNYASQGGGVIAVMHDLNLSAMYADHLVLMKEGAVAIEGPPSAVLTRQSLSHVFDCPIEPNVIAPNMPFILPQSMFASSSCGLQ